MIEPFLKSQLEPVAARHRQWRLQWQLALCWAMAALAGFLIIVLQKVAGVRFPWLMPLLAGATAIASVLIWKRTQKWAPDFRHIARQIEQHHPDLHALLLTAVEQRPEEATGKFNYLQQRVIREAVSQNERHQWLETIPRSRLMGLQWVQLFALAALVFALFGLRGGAPGSSASAVATIQKISVTPGDTSIERGSALVVLARFEGPLPSGAELAITADAGNSRRIPLVKNLDDPVFGGSVSEVTTNFSYHIEYAGQQTREFKVTVFEHPRLERADAKIHFPDYTGLAEKEIKDTHRISAVEGSQLDLALQLNKPVATARLIAKDKSVVPLLTDTNKPAVTLKAFSLDASQTYELQLVDTEGRTNKVPAQFILEALKNRTPELKLASPRGDQRVSPIEELAFQGEAWDDFGLRSYGLAYTVAGQETKFIELGQTTAANEKRPFSYLLKLEELSVKPDQLISYFIWADDIGPDGKLRRTSSDMYFAEVRPLDEIFREGQSQEGQGEPGAQKPGNESTKLAELQKQIINATWKLQRQSKAGVSPARSTNAPKDTGETPAQLPPAPRYQEDTSVVQQSQGQALEQAEAMEERAQDPRAKTMIQAVEQEMEKALKHLTAATNSPASLPAASAAEQAAYQALLQLSAREYQVSQNRSRSQSGQSASQQPNQRQLDQLDLKPAENRYETQRQAAPQQNAEQREQLQVLSRLKELAQRQQDLNERLKELQTALQEAKTEAEREEVRRRLKRLREEEQEMLADIDELRQRMDQPENQSRMAEARQQLDQTRSKVQQATEALDKESAPDALASGTRAERELQQLRDDFRKKNSNQFTDEMRQMRSDARELAQKQEEIGKKLDSLVDTKQKTLSDSGETKPLAQQLQQQKNGMTNLLDNMRRVSEQAEPAEPLLSKQLYDTLRKASQDDAHSVKDATEDLVRNGMLSRSLYDKLQSIEEEKGGKSLGVASELLQQKLLPQASQAEQRARQGIDEIKRGVEHAAESILGDDTEALRMAKRELDDLTRQLDDEIAQADADAASQAKGKQNTPSPDGKSGQQPGQKGSPQSASQAKQSNQPGNEEAQSAAAQKGDSQGKSGQSPSDQDANQPDPSDQASKGQGGKGKGQSSEKQDSQGQPGSEQSQASAQGAQGQANTPGQPKPGGTPQQASSQQPGQGDAPGANPGQRNGTGQRAGAQRQGLQNLLNQAAANNGGGEGGSLTKSPGPLTGEDFSTWSDRLRDVEEMIDLPEVRSEVARVRGRARAVRLDLKQKREKPDWAVVKLKIAQPLAEVRNRLGEELARRQSADSLVPIDRDPVPNKFSDLVRQYYEKLGGHE